MLDCYAHMSGDKYLIFSLLRTLADLCSNRQARLYYGLLKDFDCRAPNVSIHCKQRSFIQGQKRSLLATVGVWAAVAHSVVLIPEKVFRPELLQTMRTPINADSFSGFAGKNVREDNDVTRELLNRCALLMEDDSLLFGNNSISSIGHLTFSSFAHASSLKAEKKHHSNGFINTRVACWRKFRVSEQSCIDFASAWGQYQVCARARMSRYVCGARTLCARIQAVTSMHGSWPARDFASGNRQGRSFPETACIQYYKSNKGYN